MVSQKTLERVKECHNLITQGVPKRQAYKQAHTDQDTYNKHLHLLSPQKSDNIIEGVKTTDNLFKDKAIDKGGNNKRLGRPRLEDMKKVRINVNLEPKYIQMIQARADETGIPFATLAAAYLVAGLKQDMGKKLL